MESERARQSRQKGGERERERGRSGGRGDREQTVAGSPTNQNVDEGIWVWLGDSGGNAGQDKFAMSFSLSPSVSGCQWSDHQKYMNQSTEREGCSNAE